MEKIITQKMSLEDAKKLGIDTWGSWGCEPSVFDWEYSDKEIAYVFNGDVIVSAYGEDTHITGGMLVTFPKGMKCVWNVKERIDKVYMFQ